MNGADACEKFSQASTLKTFSFKTCNLFRDMLYLYTREMQKAVKNAGEEFLETIKSSNKFLSGLSSAVYAVGACTGGGGLAGGMFARMLGIDDYATIGIPGRF